MHNRRRGYSVADYVIVGGGSAGCVLANRLSADDAAKVTLIEAGGWDKSVFIRMPAGYFQLMKTGQLDWGYHTEPQTNLSGRKMFWPRARVLGGCSCVNGMVYIRGNAADYDHWARLGNRNWSYSDCLPYFRASEAWGGVPDAFHGTGGLLHTSRYGVRHPLSKAFVDAGLQAGYKYNHDFNGVDQEGFGPCDSTLHSNGPATIRASSAYSFLRPIRHRPNLTISTRALVARVLFAGDRAVGVEVLRQGRRETVMAEREVIISAGAINSPQLLQISGIGDPQHLEKIGVNVVAPLLGVGQNLQDHAAVGVQNRVRQPISLLPYVRPAKSALALLRYLWNKTGPGAYHGIEALAFIKTQPTLKVPDLQFHFEMIMYSDHGRNVVPEHGCNLYLNVTRPKSRGWIKAVTSSPTEHPLIQPNYFESKDDLNASIEGVRIGRKIFAQSAFDAYRGAEYAPGPEVTSDREIEDYLKSRVESVYHPVGTCKMGTDELAVVDDRLRVHGVRGLRVADASIMPTLVSGNTNAPTIMIAERAADFILRRREISRRAVVTHDDVR